MSEIVDDMYIILENSFVKSHSNMPTNAQEIKDQILIQSVQAFVETRTLDPWFTWPRLL